MNATALPLSPSWSMRHAGAHRRARAAARRRANTGTRVRLNRLSFANGVQFDRLVSVEMFEHMRNYQMLMRRISGWLKPAGTLFVHIFTHKTYAYPFEVRDASD